MKKIIKKYRPEETKYYCDKHLNRRSYTQLKIISWYGSCYDMNELTLHLCDECLKNMYSNIKNEFNVEPKEMLF